MALFVLKEGFQVETTDSGGRVVHKRTGDALDLSAPEVELLARATAGGIDAREPGYGPLVKKLGRLGLLIQAPSSKPPSPVAAAVAGGGSDTAADEEGGDGGFELTVEPEAPPRGEDKVPLFRRDLQHVRKSEMLVEVTDPAANRSFTLYDFELSLARMLDGTRTLAEVVESGRRLGIPVNLESLGQFIRQLRRYGFLAPEGAMAASLERHPPREQWDESLRVLFQAGLRMNRQGRYAEAAGYFEAMLHQDPDNLEAQEMLAQVRQRLSPARAADASRPSVGDPFDAPLVELLFDAEPELPVDSPQPRAAAARSTTESVVAAWARQESRAEAQTESPAADERVAEEAIEIDVDEPGVSPQAQLPPPVAQAAPRLDVEGLFDVEPKALIESEKARSSAEAPRESVVLGSHADQPVPEVAGAVEVSSEPAPDPAAVEAAWEAGAIGDSRESRVESREAPVEGRESRVESSRSAGSKLGLVLGVIAGLAVGTGGGWYFGYEAGRKAGLSELAAAPGSQAPKTAAPDGEATLSLKPAAEPADEKASGDAKAVVEKPGSREVATPVALVAGVDAGPSAAADAPADAPDDEVDDVPDEDDLEPEPEPAGIVPAAAAGEGSAREGEWAEFEIGKRGRVTMCSITAPASGSVSWEASPRQRLRSRQPVGSQGGQPLVPKCVGLLIPRVADGETAAKGALLAEVVYHEGFLQTVVSGKRPEPNWRCQIVGDSAAEVDDCKVVKAVPRGGGFFLTATFEPMWVDDAKNPRLRLAPPD
ncbi:MAG: tetratricopeptide repeat protein [Myxococcales bacterium]|jgi:hypothetical protein